MVKLATAGRILKNNIVFGLVAIAFIATTVCTAYFVTMDIVSARKIFKMFEPLAEENCVYLFQKNGQYELPSELMGAHAESVIQISATEKAQGNVFVLLYGNNLSENLRSNVKQGVWFTEKEPQTGEISVVVSDGYGYKTGEAVNITVQNNAFVFRIVGIIEKNFSFVSNSNYGSDMSAEQVIKEVDKSRPSRHLFVKTF